jgi:hypothetical protein
VRPQRKDFALRLADRVNAGEALFSALVIRIAISEEAFVAIVATLQFGSIDYESVAGGRFIWLEETWLNQLDAIRMPGESYSDVILWLVELEAAL